LCILIFIGNIADSIYDVKIIQRKDDYYNEAKNVDNNMTYYREVEPNDTIDQAMLMKRNNDSYTATVNSNRSVLHKGLGELSSSEDVDWFKVYLYANETSIYPNDNNVNIHAYNPSSYDPISGNMTFDIYDENENLINSFNYRADKKIFQAEIPEDGFYYIRLHSEN